MGLRKEQTMNKQTPHLKPSPLLDFNHAEIEQLIVSRGWRSLPNEYELIGAIYSFVRDEIAYGYSSSFSTSASKTLQIKRGNCFTKSTLLMALLRGVGIPCRLHVTTISNIIFRGLVPSYMRTFLMKDTYHAWVEPLYNNAWLPLEGHIIDLPYIKKLHKKYPDYMGSFYGYGMAVLNFKNPDTLWSGSPTYVQNKAIMEDLGVFDTPDSFFEQFPRMNAYTRSFRYQKIIRKQLNKNIRKVRNFE